MSASTNSNKPSGRAQRGLGIRFVLLVIASLAAMLLDHRQGHVSKIREALSVVVYPVQVLVDSPFRLYSWARAAVEERTILLDENEQLKRELLESEFELQRLEALKVENARLRDLLDSTARLDGRRLVAEILSVDLDPYRQRFVINRGAVILRCKEPAVRWINEADPYEDNPGLTLESVNH